ncbi:hypothetical protein ACYSUW_13375 [Pseudomonas frederiksbergensis]
MNSSMQQVVTAGCGNRFEHAGRSFRVCVEREGGRSFVLVAALDPSGEELTSDACDTSRSYTADRVETDLASVIWPMCEDIAATLTAASL